MADSPDLIKTVFERIGARRAEALRLLDELKQGDALGGEEAARLEAGIREAFDGVEGVARSVLDTAARWLSGAVAPARDREELDARVRALEERVATLEQELASRESS